MEEKYGRTSDKSEDINFVNKFIDMLMEYENIICSPSTFIGSNLLVSPTGSAADYILVYHEDVMLVGLCADSEAFVYMNLTSEMIEEIRHHSDELICIKLDDITNEKFKSMLIIHEMK